MRSQALLAVVCLLLGVLILIAFIYLRQDRFVYFPYRTSLAELIATAELHGVQLWPTADQGYRGLVSPGSEATRGTAVLFHGNGGSAVHRLHYLVALERLGYRVVLAEYPRYGAREGRPSEQGFIVEARAVARLAVREFGGPLYIWGESLGCGVAAAVAGDPTLPVEGLVLITPFANLPDLAQSLYGFLPVKWLVRERYDSISHLQAFDRPVAVLVAQDDEIIPAEQARRLYDSLATRKRMWVFEGAGHNTWPTAPDQAWWGEVTAFLQE